MYRRAPGRRVKGVQVAVHEVGSQEPIVGPEGSAPETDDLVAVPRLARHEIVLDDDHRVGVSVCGEGLPVVLVHGFTAEGILYAQTLSRLVGMGFKVVAIDVAGHGATQGLPTGGDDLDAYTELLARVLTELGIRRAVFAGHSMGGRLVAQLAAEDPDRAIAVILIDAVVGECWDRMVRLSMFAPPVLVALGRCWCSTRCRRCRGCATRARPPSSAGSSPPPWSATPAGRGGCWGRRSR